MTARICLACEKPINGRVDKKFCDDSCRNNYNNRINSNYSNTLVLGVNNILRKNRRILEDLLAPLEKKVLVIERQKLVEKGFQFDYITEHFHPGKKDHYYYCYEYGYVSVDPHKILIAKDSKKHFVRENRLVEVKGR